MSVWAASAPAGMTTFAPLASVTVPPVAPMPAGGGGGFPPSFSLPPPPQPAQNARIKTAIHFMLIPVKTVADTENYDDFRRNRTERGMAVKMTPMTEEASLTDLIRRAQNGETGALQSVFEVTYEELRMLARGRLQAGGRSSVALDTTALVHECYLRFATAKRLSVEDRVHFFRYAGRAMRSVIVDLARGALRAKRGSGEHAVTLGTTISESTSAGEEQVLHVHEALEELAQVDPRLVQVVEMRYFAGLTEVEIAAALGVTDRTIRRDWEKARMFLAEALAE
jgi:RNA polymerase sigma factor (TIGR02999 family)